MRRVLTISIVGLGTQALSLAAHAQGCVLCYTSVAGGGAVAVSALHEGILWLLVPALLLFIAVCSLIVRRARAANQAMESPAASPARVPSIAVPVQPARQRRRASVTA